MSVKIMIDGSIKHTRKGVFERQSSHVITEYRNNHGIQQRHTALVPFSHFIANGIDIVNY